MCGSSTSPSASPSLLPPTVPTSLAMSEARPPSSDSGLGERPRTPASLDEMPCAGMSQQVCSVSWFR